MDDRTTEHRPPAAADQAPAVRFLLQDAPRLYGAERAMLELIGGLRGAGADADVLLMEECRLGPGALGAALEGAEIPVRRIPVRGRMSPEVVRALRSLAREAPRRILHASGYKANVHAAFAPRGQPTVTTVHGWLRRRDPLERFYEWLEARILRRFTRVIVPSRFYLDWVRRLVPDPSRCAYVAPGVRPGPAREAASVRRFGFLGRLSEEKDPAAFVRAAAAAARERAGLEFRVAGEGPLAMRLQGLARDLGAPVVFEGYVEAEDFLGRMDALVCCSRIENAPRAVLEAMARGLPVIATRAGGLPELVEHGATGLLTPVGDAGALASAMVSLALDPARAAELGRTGRARSGREFVLDRTIAAHLAIYRSHIPTASSS
jgi:glycosyltransferase involved in cell wall biosynthesis